MESDAAEPEVMSNPVSGAASAVATAGAGAPPIMEQRVEMLLTELEELVPQLSEATMAMVLVRVRAMAASVPSRATAGDDGSPLRPEQLSFANQGGVLLLTDAREDDARSEAGSVGSVGDGAASGVEAGARGHEDEDETTEGDDPRADTNGWGDLDIDFNLWQPSTNWAAAGFDHANESANICADCAIEAYDGDVTARERRGHSRRDELGLRADGRTMFCDFHDQAGGVPHACMAVDMLQQRRIAEVVERHRKIQREKPREDPDGRRARHAMYKAVVAWQWANPLGSENRVRLPRCVLHRVRRLFPNPCCRVGTCDFLVECERAGHYTGFRTAEESRAIREGRFVGVDLR